MTSELVLEPVPDVDHPVEECEAYYDGGRKSFWIKNTRGGWTSVTEGSMKRQLQMRGYSNKRQEGNLLSLADDKLAKIQIENDVAYAGPLAGYSSGPREIGEHRILVTTSPNIIVPVPGDWPVIRQFLHNLLGTDEHDQLAYLYGWLKCGFISLRNGIPKHGQAMTIAGEKGCGKSLLQRIFTVILGGRAAKPYRYMTGGTDFNADLFGCEHLMIEDESASTDMRARRALANKIKNFTVNTVQSCHAKGCDALSLEPFWRLSITLNDSPEDLLVLPPIDDTISDKIIMLKARRAPMPMPTATPDQQQKFWNTLVAELPAFLAFLLEWEIRPKLRCERFGVRAFQHPELLEALSELASESKLLRLIDEVIFGPDGPPCEPNGDVGCSRGPSPKRTSWVGTAEALERLLLRSDFVQEAKKLLYWSNATGTFLGHLARDRPDRVLQRRTGSSRKWEILPPRVE